MSLFPTIEPFNSGLLRVDDVHEIYFEEVGNPQGIPILFLHGGPGGGITPDYRQYFNPLKWRVVLFDQRGCGKSKPFAELKNNTTWDLVSDIEQLRKFLAIEDWCVFGGSWGSTLALTYAQAFPKNCKALFLRGIFLLRDKEIQWFYQDGASKLFPDAWEKYLEPIPQNERNDLIAAFYKQLTSTDKKTRIKAAKAWSQWEASTSKLIVDKKLINDFGDEEFAIAFARIECHYFYNKGFFKDSNQLINNIDKIRHIPSYIVHGRYDVVCPLESAWELHKAWPEAHFNIIPDAGHSLSELGIQKTMLKILDEF